MAKTKRGKALKAEGLWRGTCPLCGKKRVKLAWNKEQKRDSERVCKACYARLHRP